MKILEIRLLEFLFKIRYRIKIKFKSDFETKDIFPEMERNDFGKASTEFWLRI
jgi:hypothetical protein